MNGRNAAPVREGDELEVKIEAVGEKGDGIAKVDGFVLFVPKTQAGEVVKVRITRVLKNVGFAEKIGNGESPVETQEAPAEQPREEAPAEQPVEEESQYEDTEDFGEEPKEEVSAEESTEEVPAEEPAEENPVE